MSRHWYDREKGRGVEQFNDAQERRIGQEPEIKPPLPPQPQLTPNGPLRNYADQKAREQRSAEIARQKEKIRQKFKQDRMNERTNVR